MKKKIAPKVSVIIPAFNIEKYIKYTVRSVLRQTLESIEVIIVNDGSTDGTLRILEKIRESDARIILIDRANTGVSGARNDGIDAASGKYICFVDGDDILADNMLEIMYQEAERVGAQLSTASIQGFTNERLLPVKASLGGVLCTDSHSALMDMLYGRNILNSQCSKLYLRSHLGSQRFDIKTAYGEDMLFNHYFMLKKGQVAILHFTPYFYRQRSGSAMAIPYTMKRADSLFAAKRILDEAIVTQNCELITAATNKMFTESVSILGLMSGPDHSNELRTQCAHFIQQNKWLVLKNPQTDKKNRIFALLAVINSGLPSVLVRQRNRFRRRSA